MKFHFVYMRVLLIVLMFFCGASAQHFRGETGLSAMGPQSTGNTEFENFDDVPVLKDPLRPINRGSYHFTRAFYDYIGMPASKGWRWLAPTGLRKSIQNFGYNLSYPVRLAGLGLQGEGKKSWEETKHFAVNTTVGVLGLFDPAAKWDIPTYREDLGQVMGKWGVGHGPYIFLPVLGPSSARNAVGRVGEYFLDPASYVPFLSYFFVFNSTTFAIDGYEALKDGRDDLYDPFRALWAIHREVEIDDYVIPEEAYVNSDPEPSLGGIWLKKPGPKFLESGLQKSARSDATGRKVPFTAWIQKEKSPLVYLIPGIGAHRHSTLVTFLAELLYKEGCSVVTISSPFHSEFIKNGLTAVFPGYTLSDSEDIYAALQGIDRKLSCKYPGRFSDRRLGGYSLGALASAYIADLEELQKEPAIGFSRYLLLNPPVDMQVSVKAFDDYFKVHKEWDADEGVEKIRDVAKRTFVFLQNPGVPGDPMPFDRTESEFMVGLGVRMTMLSALNAGMKRDGYKGDVDLISMQDLDLVSAYFYADEYAMPYYHKVSDGLPIEEMRKRISLDYVGETMASNKSLKVITNADDFIINQENIAWLKETVDNRVTVFPTGGHLGNVWDKKVQQQILDDLVR